MTLDYASPEQVRGEPITTATDIYSLGVLLYKLLTGKSPYGLAARSDSALRKAICEQEPVKPSAVVLTDEKAVIPDATQKIDVTHEETRDKARRRLKKKLAGDLDMIVLMALRKDPLRRYASVEQFSEDIRRYVEGRPVIARSDTFGYRATTFLRRNALTVATASVAGLTLLGATIFELRSASRAAQKDSVAEARLNVVEAEAVRQQLELSKVYDQLAESQSAPAALETYRRALASSRAFEQTQSRRSGSFSFHRSHCDEDRRPCPCGSAGSFHRSAYALGAHGGVGSGRLLCRFRRTRPRAAQKPGRPGSPGQL